MEDIKKELEKFIVRPNLQTGSPLDSSRSGGLKTQTDPYKESPSKKTNQFENFAESHTFLEVQDNTDFPEFDFSQEKGDENKANWIKDLALFLADLRKTFEETATNILEFYCNFGKAKDRFTDINSMFVRMTTHLFKRDFIISTSVKTIKDSLNKIFDTVRNSKIPLEYLSTKDQEKGSLETHPKRASQSSGQEFDKLDKKLEGMQELQNSLQTMLHECFVRPIDMEPPANLKPNSLKLSEPVLKIDCLDKTSGNSSSLNPQPSQKPTIKKDGFSNETSSTDQLLSKPTISPGLEGLNKLCESLAKNVRNQVSLREAYGNTKQKDNFCGGRINQHRSLDAAETDIFGFEESKFPFFKPNLEITEKINDRSGGFSEEQFNFEPHENLTQKNLDNLDSLLISTNQLGQMNNLNNLNDLNSYPVMSLPPEETQLDSLSQPAPPDLFPELASFSGALSIHKPLRQTFSSGKYSDKNQLSKNSCQKASQSDSQIESEKSSKNTSNYPSELDSKITSENCSEDIEEELIKADLKKTEMRDMKPQDTNPQLNRHDIGLLEALPELPAKSPQGFAGLQDFYTNRHEPVLKNPQTRDPQDHFDNSYDRLLKKKLDQFLAKPTEAFDFKVFEKDNFDDANPLNLKDQFRGHSTNLNFGKGVIFSQPDFNFEKEYCSPKALAKIIKKIGKVYNLKGYKEPQKLSTKLITDFEANSLHFPEQDEPRSSKQQKLLQKKKFVDGDRDLQQALRLADFLNKKGSKRTNSAWRFDSIFKRAGREKALRKLAAEKFVDQACPSNFASDFLFTTELSQGDFDKLKKINLQLGTVFKLGYTESMAYFTSRK